jgi:uncharacterized protein (TIGR03000 family)
MYRWQLWVPALALAALLFTTSSASAQRGGRGGWGNSGYSNGYYGRGYYGNGWNNGYYGNGFFGPGYYNNGWYGRGYYGNAYSGNNGYYNSSPSYADYDPNYYGQQPASPQQGYTSFYPQEQMPRNAALVRVHVPRNADLWFDGDKTSQTGSERDFVTPELKTDKDYVYTLKARWTDPEGKSVEQTRRVKVHAGTHAMVDFFRPDQSVDNRP